MSQEIKKSIEVGDFAKAIELLEQQLKGALDSIDALSLSRLIKKIPASEFTPSYLKKKVAVLSGYTSTFIEEMARVEFFRRKIRVEIYNPGFGLHEQAIYSKDVELARFKPDLAYFCVGVEHLARPLSSDSERVRWSRLWKATHELLGCDIIMNTFEEPAFRSLGHFERKWMASESVAIHSLNHAMAQVAPEYVHLLDIDWLASHHGRSRWRDERLYDLSKMPVAEVFLPAYASAFASVGSAIFGRTKKVLVLDLDNTLWGGIIGDDGLSGIEIGEGNPTGEAHLRFQKYVKALKDRGVVLAVCSKNQEEIAREAFVKRPEMALKLADISCFVANWEPKSSNIRQIAKQLNLGLDSFVFVDDNPAEREIVRRELPEVDVIELPADPAEYVSALGAYPGFEIVRLTQEDLQKAEQYRSNLEREKLESTASNYSEYLESLQMAAAAGAFDSEHIPRISQLINKTNQFNLTTRRYSVSEVEAMAADPRNITLAVKHRDRFGDNGLISVLIAKPRGGDPDSLEIDSWLMSCRVLKRNVEVFLFQELVRKAKDRGVQEIWGTYIPTAKNKLVEGLLPELGFEMMRTEMDDTKSYLFRMDGDSQSSVLTSATYITSVPWKDY